MEVQALNGAAKRNPEEETDSAEKLSDLSEVCRYKIVEHPPSCQLDIAVHPQAHVKRKSIKQAEDRSETLVSLYFLSSLPRRPRSKRIVNHKNLSIAHNADFHDDQLEKSSPCQLRCPARRRARQKRKRRQKDEDTYELEVVCPSLGRERLKRRVTSGNSPQREGKLDTDKFESYLENLWMSFSEEKRNSFTYLDCLWFSLYKKESFEAKVLNWIKKKRIFTKKYVFVPIVRWCHWSLLILCHFGESLQSKSGTPCMLLLDSLQMANPKRLEPEIRKFVLGIYKAEERPENKRQIYQIPLKIPKVPQQRNAEECGNFVLHYINLFIESAPESFSISEGYPYFMKEDWFTPEGLACFCKKLDSYCL